MQSGRRGLVANLLLSRNNVLLDTSAIIYFLTGREPYMAHLVPLFNRVLTGQTTAFVSTVTEAELLVRPEKEGDREAALHIADLLSEDGIEVIPMNRRIARRAASVRARHDLAPADAIIVATAIESGCDAVVGNDRRWQRLDEIDYVHLDALAQSSTGSTA